MEDNLIKEFRERILDKTFPCVAARDAASKDNIDFLCAGHLACPNEDKKILQFIYSFVTKFRKSEIGFYSAIILFPFTKDISEDDFEKLLFQRLKALRELDAEQFGYDKRVSDDPLSNDFSFSLMEEAFFIIGLHPNSSRPARQFSVPAIVFNPHVQFEILREKERYQKMKKIIRKRDLEYSGSINPMLTDFGTLSEVYQYSGKAYQTNDKCPFGPW